MKKVLCIFSVVIFFWYLCKLARHRFGSKSQWGHQRNISVVRAKPPYKSLSSVINVNERLKMKSSFSAHSIICFANNYERKTSQTKVEKKGRSEFRAKTNVISVQMTDVCQGARLEFRSPWFMSVNKERWSSVLLWRPVIDVRRPKCLLRSLKHSAKLFTALYFLVFLLTARPWAERDSRFTRGL